MLSINTNLPSLIAQSSLKNSTNKLNTAIERMTTGFKINSAKDNAANYSIVMDMGVKLSSYEVAEDNVAMGLDLVSTVEGALSQIQDKLERLRALQEQASNGTYGEDSLKAINTEAKAIVEEICRIYSNTEYNGIKLLGEINTSTEKEQITCADFSEKETINDGQNFSDFCQLDGQIYYATISGYTTPVYMKVTWFCVDQVNDINPITLQVGINAEKNSTIYLVSGGVNLTNLAYAACIGSKCDPYWHTEHTTKNGVLDKIDTMIDSISEKLTEYGAVQNRLESALEEISTHYENLVSSRSTLKDADIAEVSSEYIKQQILQQASATLLATANQTPALALQLL